MFRLDFATFFRALVVACALAIGVVAAFRYLSTPDRLRLGELELRNARLHGELNARLLALETRVDELERTVYGASPPPVPKPVIVGAQSWQKNRDAQLRARIEALERWRMGFTP